METSQFSPLKKSKAVHTSTGKVMMTFFFDCRGPPLVDFLERGATINVKHYADTLQKLQHAIKSNCPGTLLDGIIHLHDDAIPLLQIWWGINFRDLAGKHFNILRTAQIFSLVTSTFLAT